MGEMTPVCGGAQYRDVSQSNTHGNLIRVKSVWIDEDGETQVQIFNEGEHTANPKSETVDAESFIDSIDDTLIRVNSDHEAWEWRN